MRTFSLQTEVWLPRSRKDVFDFFSDAGNLEILTPPWLDFGILTARPIEMRVGTLIDYRLGLHGIPLRWQSEITRWNPPEIFVDEQRRGPYRRWVHEHRFKEKDGGTLVEDSVEYGVWGGGWIARWLVAPDLKKIFSYRHTKLQEIFSKTD